MKIISKLLFSLVSLVSVLLSWPTCARAEDDSPLYQVLPFHIDSVKERMVAADMNGDGLSDFLISSESKLSLFLQKSDRPVFDFTRADTVLELPGAAAGWDIDYTSGKVGDTTAKRVVALIDGKKLLSWSFNGDSFDEAQELLDNVAGFLPPGYYPLRMVRDVNSDGYSDFLVPGSGNLNLYLHLASGKYSEPITMAVSMNQPTFLGDNENISSRIGGSVTVGNLRLRDINADGRNDIISEASEFTEIFIADHNGTYPEKATIQNKVSNEVEIEIDDIMENMDNLSRLVNYIVAGDFEDIDGDGFDDFFLRHENKVSIFLGNENGLDLSKPNQVLKSGGNLLFPLFYDEDDDGFKDLILVRLEDISVGDVIVKAILATSVKVEGFVYRKKGRVFATRPHRKITVSIDIPNLLKLPELFSNDDDTVVTKSEIVALENDNQSNDVVVLRRNTVETYRDIPGLVGYQQIEMDLVLKRLIGLNAGQDSYSIDLEDIIEFSQNSHLTWVGDREPDGQIPFGDGESSIDLKVADIKKTKLNADNRDDLIVFTNREEDSVDGYLLMSH